jgi:hypothetical protein
MIKNDQTSSLSLVRSGYRDGKVGVGMVNWESGDEAYLFNILHTNESSSFDIN